MWGICALGVLLFGGAAYAADKPTYVRAPVLRGVGSDTETAITAEVLTAASLLLTATPGWAEWPSDGSATCAPGCWIVQATCVGQEVQRCEVVVVEQPSNRQDSGQLTVRGLAPANDVAQALVLQAAYLLEKLRQPVEPRALVAPAHAPVTARALDAWDVAFGPSLLVSSGISAWGVETAILLGLSPHTFVRIGAGYAGVLAAAGGGGLDYFHAVPIAASFGARGTWARLTGTASLGLVVMPVFASSGHVADSDLAVVGCVELGLRYPLAEALWLGALARPYYGTGDVTLGESGSEPFVLPKWGVLSTVQIGVQL